MTEPTERDREMYKSAIDRARKMSIMADYPSDFMEYEECEIIAMIAAAREEGRREERARCVAVAHGAIEQCSEEAHNDWLAEKRRLGLTSWVNHQGIEQMVPWSDLSGPDQEFDRIVVSAAVRRIAQAIGSVAEPTAEAIRNLKAKEPK